MEMWMTRLQKGRQRWGSIAVAVMLCLRLAGCGSAENSTAPIVQSVGTVTGQVVSLANDAPVSGAAVKTETGTTTTAVDGKFTVSAPVGDRSVVRVEASGFAEAFPVARVTSGQATILGVKLVPIGVTETVSVTSGGTVSVPNSPARVTIPANGLVPVAGGTPAGSVNVSLTPINPAQEPRVMPGGFNGIAAGGGSVQPLESGGAMQVDVRDSAGARYTLAPGTTATIRIPLRTQSANPPATMPLWFFDDTAGVWREDGTATLQGTGANRYYEGPVTRVTYWNADLVLDSIVVKGCVKDANGQVVANALVETKGIDYTGTSTDLTAADGTFSVAMRKSGQANLSVVEFDQQTFALLTLSNLVKVGPSATDISLANCLVKQPGPLAITTAALPSGRVGAAYNQTLAASGSVPGYVWSLNSGSNPLPAGLELNPAGVISGTPTAASTTAITIKVTDSTGGTKTKEFSLTINTDVQPLTITTTALPAGTVGTAYNATLAATGGAETKSWSGTLPAGLRLEASTGVISGTPTTAGTSTVTLRVQDSGNPQRSTEKAFDITIASVTPPPPPPPPPSCGENCLTVSNAPASVGERFSAILRLQTNSVVAWDDMGSSPLAHLETLLWAVESNQFTGVTPRFVFTAGDAGVGTSNWTCVITTLQGFTTCSGVAINKAGGTISFNNTVLSDVSVLGTPASPITLNGTLNFTPF